MLRIHYKVMAVLNAIGTAWVAGITVLICSDIVGRALFSFPIIGVPEIVKVSVVAIVWPVLMAVLILVLLAIIIWLLLRQIAPAPSRG